MPSSLIPEKPLVISPSLAATIGLEEAVMLQGLHEIMEYSKAEIVDGFKWYQFDRSALQQRFPFWQDGDIQRVAKLLKEKGVIVLGDNNYLTTMSLKLALNEKVVAAVSSTQTGSEPTKKATEQAPATDNTPPPKTTQQAPPKQAPPKKGRYKMYSDWQPDGEIIKQIKQLGVPPSFIEECLPEFIHYWTDRDEAHHGWGSKFRSWVSRRWREEETLFAAKQNATEMSEQWQPDVDAVEILLRAGVEKQFIEDAVPEFVLYWRERGDSTSTWNSKFVQHIRLQWARYTHAIKHETEPTVIDPDWHPSPELYEVLHMANIDRAFADSLIQEFILYWQESKQLQRSWNSKFLQHVKYHWARRHSTSDGKQAMGFIERQTDKGWLKG